MDETYEVRHGMVPNFLIVGAMKGGTTSLAAALRRHDDIYMPRREVHFFNIDARYSQGLPEYQRHFEEVCGEKAIGEKTPTYSYQDNVPERIARLLPETKIIWIFREPVARTYSHYWFFVSMGKERLTFEDALEREAQGKAQDFTMRYRDRSVYIKQVRRYLRFFPQEQMLYLLFEEYLRDPGNVLARTCRFLGVDDAFDFANGSVRANVTVIPRSIRFQWLSYQLFKRRGARVLRIVKKINRKRIPGYPPMSAETRRELTRYFASHNLELARETGLDLRSWQK